MNVTVPECWPGVQRRVFGPEGLNCLTRSFTKHSEGAWGRHVTRMRKDTNVTRTLVANLKGRDLLQDLGVYGGIILKRVLEIVDRMVWSALIWLSVVTGGGLL